MLWIKTTLLIRFYECSCIDITSINTSQNDLKSECLIGSTSNYVRSTASINFPHLSHLHYLCIIDEFNFSLSLFWCDIVGTWQRQSSPFSTQAQSITPTTPQHWTSGHAWSRAYGKQKPFLLMCMNHCHVATDTAAAFIPIGLLL